jgi:hypothetical protein
MTSFNSSLLRVESSRTTEILWANKKSSWSFINESKGETTRVISGNNIAGSWKLLPLYTPEIYDQVIDLPVEKPPLIFITEKEYLELKNEVGYWQAMQNKAPFRRIKKTAWTLIFTHFKGIFIL